MLCETFIAFVVWSALKVQYFALDWWLVRDTWRRKQFVSIIIPHLFQAELQKAILCRIVSKLRASWLWRRICDYDLWGQKDLPNHDYDSRCLPLVREENSSCQDWAVDCLINLEGHPRCAETWHNQQVRRDEAKEERWQFTDSRRYHHQVYH